ncbi:hypothetical protein KM043_006120 [Ampulex compressa]|nr:hypothetical protein KM043_006120 [Ampulex compressa]
MTGLAGARLNHREDWPRKGARGPRGRGSGGRKERAGGARGEEARVPDRQKVLTYRQVDARGHSRPRAPSRLGGTGSLAEPRSEPSRAGPSGGGDSIPLVLRNSSLARALLSRSQRPLARLFSLGSEIPLSGIRAKPGAGSARRAAPTRRAEGAEVRASKRV